MRRESLKLQESDWQRLEELAAATNAIYSGRPSWRGMILRIARNEIRVQLVGDSHRRKPQTPEVTSGAGSGKIM